MKIIREGSLPRHYRRRGARKSISEIIGGWDWSMDASTAREVVSVALILVGTLITLGLFGLAGSFGHFFYNLSLQIWGYWGYVVPFVFLAYGIVLFFPKSIKVKAVSVIGVALLFSFLPAILAFSGNGGWWGEAIHKFFESLFGYYGALLGLFGLTIVSILIIFNTSLITLWEKFGPKASDNVRVNEARASVFATLQRDNIARPYPVAPTSPLIMTADKNWQFPPLDLLEVSNSKASPGNITKNVEIIEKTLKDFGVDVSMGDVNVGPTVTQYTLKPADGVKLNQITARVSDLSLSLAMHPIRIEAPIPGKAAVGVEVPNKISALVTLREILESDSFKNMKSNLRIALGRDVAGDPFVTDLKKMPHLLIAGSTGSGKSVGIHGIIMSLLYQNAPSDLRMLMVDPKRVEFTAYNDIPHLLSPVVHDIDKTVATLRWAVAEMDRRFTLFQTTNRRNIEAYNADPPQGHIPYIVIVIDELADLMAQAGNEVEAAIVRLAQMARAVGIHLVVATQRPSVDVITGLIKANITNRIAFAVASQVDSRTILDLSGAERLLGNGDMLYLGNDLGKPKRVQGVMVTDQEVNKVTNFLKQESHAQYDDSISNFHANLSHGVGSASGGGEISGSDELYHEAKETVVMAGKASASLLQRRLRVGYARAARLLDMMEEEGIIGPAEGAKPRDVLIDAISLENERNQARMPMNQPPPPVNFQPTQSGFQKPTNQNQPYHYVGEVDEENQEE